MFELSRLTDCLAFREGSVITCIGASGKPEYHTFPELFQRVQEIKSLLYARLAPGSVLGLHLSDYASLIITDLACIDLGVKTIVFPEDVDREKVEQLSRQYGLLTVSDDADVEADEGQWVVPYQHFLNAQFRVNGNPIRSLSDQCFTVSFSSGTSGYTKKLSITVSGVEKFINAFCEDFELSGEDSTVVFLPLSNVQQRMQVYACIYKGIDICVTGFLQAQTQVKKMSPTFVVAPPLFFETAALFAQNKYEKIHKVLGGKVRFMVTGMAPIADSVLQFFWDAGLKLFQVYGLTETGIISWNTEQANRVGSVGKPLDYVSISYDEDDVICVHSDYPLSDGYFDTDSGVEANIFLPDGLVYTGDIGLTDEDGYLYIKGREKDVIVTNGGDKFSPELVEDKFRGKCFKNCALIYDEQHSENVLVVDSSGTLTEWRVSDGGSDGLRDINRSLPQSMRVSKVVSLGESFSLDSGYLTRNMKLNRIAIKESYLENHKEVVVLAKNF